MNFFNDAGSWDPGYQAASDGLESVCGWGISPRTIPNAFSYEQVVRSLLQTKEPPDLVKWGSGYRMRDLARTGALAALDDEWTSSVSKGWLSDAMTADFTYGDHIYGLPLIQGYYVLTFNVSVWDDLGLSKPETWDDFISVCEELKAAGLAPIGTTQQNMWPTANWFSMLSAAFSSEWYDKVCANEASFLDDEPREMLQLWQDMINAGYHSSADSLNDDFASMVQAGRVGMWPAALSWSSANFNDDQQPWQWGGTLVVHEVFQRADGSLGVRIPGGVREALSASTVIETPGFELARGDGLAERYLAEELPAQALFSTTFTVGEGTRSVALRFLDDPATGDGYEFQLLAGERRIVFARRPNYPWHRNDNRGLERPFDFSPGTEHNLQLVLDDDLVTIYVDDVALNSRACSPTGKALAVQVVDGSVSFGPSRLSTLA